MAMEVHIERTPKALDKGDRARGDGGPIETTCDRLVDVIRTDCRADDRMALGRKGWGSRHPVAPGDGPRDAPGPRGAPGDARLAAMRRHRGHTPPGTRGAQPAALAAAGPQQRG